jgi:signal transduction histidine kinase
MTPTTILKVSKTSTGREAMLRALQDAGLGVVEVDDWEQARERLAAAPAAVLVCDAASVDDDAAGLARAVADAGTRAASTQLPTDAIRELSHELRTPLSAMAGWLHLLETGKLDEAGVKRAIEKLRGNIDEQVRTLDRYVGSRTQEGNR